MLDEAGEIETKQLKLSECFKLGKALRSGDADLFCEIYDSLAITETPGVNSQLTVTTIKEVARQISELDQEDFTILANCYSPLSPASNDVSVDIYEPVTIQLAELIDKMKVDGQGGTTTSDSGHLSDYDSCETDDLKSESSSEVTLCGESDTSVLADPLFDSHGLLFEESLILKDTRIGPVVDPSDLMIQSNREKHLTEKKLAFLSQVACQNGDDIQSSKAEVFTVSQLEREFFSDSSEDVSPETSTLPSQQDDDILGESDTRGSKESKEHRREDCEALGELRTTEKEQPKDSLSTATPKNLSCTAEMESPQDLSCTAEKRVPEDSLCTAEKEDSSSKEVPEDFNREKDEFDKNDSEEEHRSEETGRTPTNEKAKPEDQKWYHRETTHGTSFHPRGWSKYYGRRGGYSKSRFRRGSYNRSHYYQNREERHGIKEVNKIREAESWTSQKPKEREVRVTFSESVSGSFGDSEQPFTSATHLEKHVADTEFESKKSKCARDASRDASRDATEMEKDKPDSSSTTGTRKGERVTLANRNEKTASKQDSKRATETKQGKPSTASSSETRRGRSAGAENKTSPERRDKNSPKHRKQLSPLVVHSQNVWSSNIEAIKSPHTKTRPSTSPSPGKHNKNYAFNHYEVGRFLMEGWENVMKEFAAGSGTLL